MFQMFYDLQYQEPLMTCSKQDNKNLEEVLHLDEWHIFI